MNQENKLRIVGSVVFEADGDMNYVARSSVDTDSEKTVDVELNDKGSIIIDPIGNDGRITVASWDEAAAHLEKAFAPFDKSRQSLNAQIESFDNLPNFQQP